MPFGTDSSRKTIYALEDSMFRFWCRFIPDNLAIINRGLTDIVYKKIAPQITSFMGGVFEEICKHYINPPFSVNANGQTKMLTQAFLIRLLKEASYSITPMFIFIYSQKQASPKAV